MLWYSARLSGNNDPNGRGDNHEGFEFGEEPLNPQDDNTEAGPGIGRNTWPAEIPKFREAALRY